MAFPYAEVIGDPIAYSQSPAIHKFWLEKLGLEGDYRAERVTAEGLASYLVGRRADPAWRGCNVTMPLKRAIIPFLGRLDRFAELADAANVVIPDDDGVRHGFNTDSLAIAELLARTGYSDYPGHVATYVQIIGAGGAAQAAAVGAMHAGYENLDFEFFSRSPEKARGLAERFALTAEHGQALADLEGFDNPLNEGKPQPHSKILINASPLGMSGYPPLSVSLDTYHNDTIILDFVYNPVETPLLREAREKGFKTIDGIQILVAQAAHSFRHLFQADPPREHDAALRELLVR
jgi:shikimate dehydrogenase